MGEELSDAVLLEAVRTGDVQAGGELFRRHAEPPRRVAAEWGPAEEWDALVSEDFARVLIAGCRGGGQCNAAQPHLLVIMGDLEARQASAGAHLVGCAGYQPVATRLAEIRRRRPARPSGAGPGSRWEWVIPAPGHAAEEPASGGLSGGKR